MNSYVRSYINRNKTDMLDSRYQIPKVNEDGTTTYIAIPWGAVQEEVNTYLSTKDVENTYSEEFNKFIKNTNANISKMQRTIPPALEKEYDLFLKNVCGDFILMEENSENTTDNGTVQSDSGFAESSASSLSKQIVQNDFVTFNGTSEAYCPSNEPSAANELININNDVYNNIDAFINMIYLTCGQFNALDKHLRDKVIKMCDSITIDGKKLSKIEHDNPYEYLTTITNENGAVAAADLSEKDAGIIVTAMQEYGSKVTSDEQKVMNILTKNPNELTPEDQKIIECLGKTSGNEELTTSEMQFLKENLTSDENLYGYRTNRQELGDKLLVGFLTQIQSDLNNGQIPPAMINGTYDGREISINSN